MVEKMKSTALNSTYPKVEFQWLNRVLFHYQNLCLVDSEVVRNQDIRRAAKRYKQGQQRQNQD